MKVVTTPIKDLVVLEPSVFRDERGIFLETFNQATFRNNGFNYSFVQDNQSVSKFGTLRGLHFQRGEAAQAKLVWVSSGKVVDVVADLRKGSPTFGRTYSVELSADNHLQLMIPRGFAHGFVCLSETAVFNYKCDNLYSKQDDAGIRFDDEELLINWPISNSQMIISEKDRNLPSLRDIKDLL